MIDIDNEKEKPPRGDEAEEPPAGWPEEVESPEAVLPPWMFSKIDEGIRRFRGRLTDSQANALRAQLAWTFATHPKARRLVELACSKEMT